MENVMGNIAKILLFVGVTFIAIVVISLIVIGRKLFIIIKENNNTKYAFIFKADKGAKRTISILILLIGIFVFAGEILDILIVLILLYCLVKYKRILGVTEDGIVYYNKFIKWSDIEKYEFKNESLLIVNCRFYFKLEEEDYEPIKNFIKEHMENQEQEKTS